MDELWYKITDYDYFVSTDGRVMNKQGVIKKPTIDKDGYRKISLWKNGKPKTFFIHRLVATYFIQNPYNKPQVDHIIPVRDGGTDDITNLRWATDEENKNNPLSLKRKIGENNPFYGKHHDKETIDNITNKNRYDIVMIKTKDGTVTEYNGINKCAKENNFDERSVYRCLKKVYAKRKDGTYKNIYKGYKFYYKDEYEKLYGSTGRN